MSDVILLGAGFSRNWGGLLANEVFEHLLAVPEIQADHQLKELLWRATLRGEGFEYALAEVQSEYSRQPEKIRPTLDALEGGIRSIYDTMNSAFLRLSSIERSEDRDKQIKRFLARFDAIYSLNQDILLERHYLPQLPLLSPDRWSGGKIAGVRRTNTIQGGTDTWAEEIWIPEGEAGSRLREGTQPLYKLHGSSNWMDEAGGRLLVIGRSKARTIEATDILKWSLEQFRIDLLSGSSRLLVIGYSFKDDHVNDVIIEGALQHGLRFFVIDPAGSDVVRYANSSYGGATYDPNTKLDQAFRAGLVGSSRRSLAETFGADTISFENVTGFWE